MILEKAKKIAHLTNINMDPSLSKTIKLLLEGDGNKVIGLPGKSDIGLAGLGIQDPHVNALLFSYNLFLVLVISIILTKREQ